MNLDELQSVQSRERQTDQLQQLRATFYEEAGQFVNQLREERSRAADRADDPFDSPEVNRLTNDIKTAEQTIEAIYERRVGKIVKMASLAAADMPTEDDGLTQEEEELFETMVEAIKANRQHVLDVIAGDAPTGAVGDGTTSSASSSSEPAHEANPAEPTQQSPTPTESSVDAADVMGSGDNDTSEQAPPTEPPEPPEDTQELSGTPTEETRSSTTESSADRPAGEAIAASSDKQPQSPPPETGQQAPDPDQQGASKDIDRQKVRITDDVGPIYGVDEREYDLSTNDVVSLPTDNATPLIEQDAAEPFE